MRVLLGCVNSTVSLIGYDVAAKVPFWYCPANVLRVCGITWHQGALWAATDALVQRLDPSGIQRIRLPGPHHNYTHSVKPVGEDSLAVADTGNSRILLLHGEKCVASLSPLEGWEQELPEDAIHLNDFISWRDGLLASAFNYQPFRQWKRSSFNWKAEGWGCLYHIRRHEGKTLARIVASGLNCPHSLSAWQGDVYCCSSAEGALFRFSPDEYGRLQETMRWHITDSHFLRGCLRLEDGWLLGGSSRRREEGQGMTLYYLTDTGQVDTLPVGGPGEIYDIIPWDAALMPGICQTLLQAPELEAEGRFPPRCELPVEYGTGS